ncbi:acyltransferase family protein [Brucella thiophenivorans]|uniref:Acyltransferase family protein n=1 Tax=Brucella thiophenivorans TaxID=571255 RepID=A0A256FX08_9HYPH|nr:acyltransferase [Brucella thiophenivorans]OYR18961.1 acyltransferase family protein [Brucella thiophenivorans]
MNLINAKSVGNVTTPLRPLLILMVVTTHVPWTYYNAYKRDFELSPTSFMLTFITFVLASSAVPTLSIISGYFAWSSYQKRGYIRLLFQKIKTILLPMLVWNGVMIALIIWKQQQNLPLRTDLPLVNGSLFTYFRALTGYNALPANGPLYFLHDLMLCFLFIYGIVLLTSNKIVGALLCLTLIAMTVALINPPLFMRVDILAWFVVGLYFARHGWPTSWSVDGTTVRTLACVYLAIAVTATFYCLCAKPADYLQYQKLVNIFGPLTILVTAVFFAGNRLFRFVSPLSKYSFTVFLCHVPVIFLVGEAWGYLTHTHISSSYLLGPLTVAVCIAVTAFLCFHVNRVFRFFIHRGSSSILHET